jgi:hypothetical protein
MATKMLVSGETLEPLAGCVIETERGWSTVIVVSAETRNPNTSRASTRIVCLPAERFEAATLVFFPW